jgi:hypothetical protein
MTHYERVKILLKHNKIDEANAIIRDYPECIEEAKLLYLGMREETIKIYEYYLNNGWKITYDYVDKLARSIVIRTQYCVLSHWRYKWSTYFKHYLYILLKKYDAPITDNTIMVLLNDMAYMLKNKTSNMVILENFTISLQKINTMFEQCVVDSLDLDNIKYIDIPCRGIDKKMYINVMLEKIPRSCASSTRIFKTIVCKCDKDILDKYLNICEQFNTKKDIYKQSPYLWCYDKKLKLMFKRLILNEIPVNKVSFPLDNVNELYHKSPSRKLMLKLAMSLGYKITEK